MVREFKQMNPNEVVGNYFKGVDRQKSEGRKDTIFKNQQKTQENVFADHDRKVAQEGEDREYLKRRRVIESDKDVKTEMDRLISMVDTTADDATYQEQISALPDALGNRMQALDFSPEDTNRAVGDFFKSGALTRETVSRLQKKMGVGPDSPKTSTAYNDLATTLGRKPTTKELREHKAKASSGQMPSDAKMVEYLVSNKIAPDRKNAYSMVQMSKSDPVKLVSGLVSSAEEAQKAAMLMPGDDGFKDRKTLIKEAQQTVMDIRKAFTTEAQGGAPEYTPKHVPGGADPRMGNMGGGSATPAPAAVQRVTPDLAAQLLQEAGGDKNAARELARQRGLTF